MIFAQTLIQLGGGQGFSLLASGQQSTDSIHRPRKAAIDADWSGHSGRLLASPRSHGLFGTVAIKRGLSCG
jgi:hypothetical protein